MIIYQHDGTLPNTWQDFYIPKSTGHPCITLLTQNELDKNQGDRPEDSTPEWRNVLVPGVEEIDEETAIQAIANSLGVDIGEVRLVTPYIDHDRYDEERAEP